MLPAEDILADNVDLRNCFIIKALMLKNITMSTIEKLSKETENIFSSWKVDKR